MAKYIGLTLILIATAGSAFASTTVPEIDPASGISALALLSGALLMLRARRKN